MTLAVEELGWSETEVPVPRHIAIIMDGNGRWATERRLSRAEEAQAELDDRARDGRAAEDESHEERVAEEDEPVEANREGAMP